MSGAKLNGSNFKHTVLKEINLQGANLSEVNLSGANLSGANLNYADLSGANLSGAILNDVKLYKTNFTGANLSNSNLTDAKIYNNTCFIKTIMINVIINENKLNIAIITDAVIKIKPEPSLLDKLLVIFKVDNKMKFNKIMPVT
jgi:uncharacterized protein YjbI with pentapeptide repeats